MQESDEPESIEPDYCDRKTAMPCMERNPWISSTLPNLQQDEMEETSEVDSSTQGMLAVDDNPHTFIDETAGFEGSVPNPMGHHYPSPVHGSIFEPLVVKSDSKDVKDPNSAVRGVCGLRNLGNTCFMNSGLQCLLCNARIVKHILEDLGERNPKQLELSLTDQFAQLLKKVWSGQYTAVHPSSFKETLGYYHSQFEDFRQHDCQEFLALLLDSLHEQLNQSKANEPQAPAQCPVIERAPEKGGDVAEEERSSASQSGGTAASAVFSQPRSTSPIIAEETSESSPEDSNESADSLQRAHFVQSDDVSHPEACSAPEVSPFPDHSSAVNEDSGRDRSNPTQSQRPADLETEITDIGKRFPTIEDLYMKDTKTLNTNVLAAEFEHDIVATDSEKYHKQDNTNPLEDPVESFSSLHGINAGALSNLVEKGEPLKPLKETNLLANHRDKFAEEGCSKKVLFSELVDAHSDCDINNIKRMKIDEEVKDKNYRMQKILKINTDRNPLHEPCGMEYEANAAEERMNNASVSNCDAQVMNNTRPKSQLSPRAGYSSSHGTQGTVAMDTDALLGAQMGFNNEQHMMAKYIQEADKEWSKYVQRNRSVVVDTFQGQFKSTVVCSECYHISVTFEPFMYLSVPIPHAMDKQISVIFVPCDNKQPIRYLVTLHKHDKVQQMKCELRKLIGEEDSCDLIVAEVFDKHISRILEDNTMLRYVNDYYRTIYAFEMLPPPSLDDVATQSSDVSSSVTSQAGGLDSDVTMLPNNIAAPPPSSCTVTRTDSPTTDDVTSTSEGADVLNNCVSSSSSYHATLEFRTDVDWQTNLLNEADSTSSDAGKMEAESGDAHVTSQTLGGGAVGAAESSEPVVFGPQNKPDTGGEERVADRWKSCAICLEELDDKELMVHASCGGTLCHACLDMTFKHYGDNAFVCPVCSTQVNPGEEFVQVNCMADYKPKTRILSVPVLQRHLCIDGDGLPEMALFGHPNLLYIASQVSGEVLYNSVDRVAPVLASYSVVLTDAQGKRCSRCLYTDHCSGCTLSRDQDVIGLIPGDHLTLHYSGLDMETRESAGKYADDKSMRGKRSDEPITLFDCFEAFTQSETLDEHNPWYCPRCRKNQCASKTITVWKYPQTLVVYLKRFVFHELVGTKIDNKVVFPLEDLDLSGYISGPKASQLHYDLQSFVCHFGGTTSGHYTAYAKHPLTDQWFHYNDELTRQQVPRDEDYGNAYVLFYQQQGEKPEIRLPARDESRWGGNDVMSETKQQLDGEAARAGPDRAGQAVLNPNGADQAGVTRDDAGQVSARAVSAILEGLRERRASDVTPPDVSSQSRDEHVTLDHPDSTSEQLDFYT